MSYWNYTGAPFPWGLFDPDAELAFSFEVGPWVSSSGVSLTLQSFTVLADPRLQVVGQGLLGTTITVRLKLADGATAPSGTRISFTLRMFLSDGQHDDRSFLLQVQQR